MFLCHFCNPTIGLLLVCFLSVPAGCWFVSWERWCSHLQVLQNQCAFSKINAKSSQQRSQEDGRTSGWSPVALCSSQQWKCKRAHVSPVFSSVSQLSPFTDGDSERDDSSLCPLHKTQRWQGSFLVSHVWSSLNIVVFKLRICISGTMSKCCLYVFSCVWANW